MKDKREKIAAIYATQESIPVDNALSVIFATKHALRMTTVGYNWYKEVVPSIRIELISPITTRQTLYLHRYMNEPFLIIHGQKPVLLMFEEKVAALILLMNNDLERFVQSKKAGLS